MGRWGNRNRGNFVSSYASDTWNYKAGQHIRVVCYTNATTARLLLNGQPIGGQPQRDAQTDILYWDIAYAPGILRCEADNGSSYEIKTTKAPKALRLTTDAVAHVFIEVVDEDGNIVRDADTEVQLIVRGARLLGMENGNIMDNSVAGRQQRNRLRVHNGSMVVYIQPQPGQQVSINAIAPYLEQGKLNF